MDIFDKLKDMRARTYFLIFGTIAILGFMLIMSYCIGEYGSYCWRTPPI